jgi:hypothetical protein
MPREVPKFTISLDIGQYIKELWDPVQTHAVYGVPEHQVPQLKNRLKSMGCKRFRIVTPRLLKGIKIVCFKAPAN